LCKKHKQQPSGHLTSAVIRPPVGCGQAKAI
jgi:hypothetical protein